MFNLIVSAIIPTNNGLQFIIPSTFGQNTHHGGLDGSIPRLFKPLNKEVHKQTDQLAAFAKLALDLMKYTQERFGKNQTSVSDVATLIHKIYHNELKDNQSSSQIERKNTNQLAKQHLNQLDKSNWM
ncbi:MAG: hypothetical protein EZS28_023601, partial [Streblomastix strix]